MVIRGIGYQTACELFGRKEDSETLDHCIYFARTHLTDHEDATKSVRGIMKVGRAKFLTPIGRGRNQGGSSFRIYGKIELLKNKDTWFIEQQILPEVIGHKNIIGEEGQRELYDLRDDELANTIQVICEIVEAETKIKIPAAFIFEDEKTDPLQIFPTKGNGRLHVRSTLEELFT